MGWLKGNALPLFGLGVQAASLVGSIWLDNGTSGSVWVWGVLYGIGLTVIVVWLVDA